jgi:hypothetical protein
MASDALDALSREELLERLPAVAEQLVPVAQQRMAALAQAGAATQTAASA